MVAAASAEVLLLTCSMARDRELFALLARSVDEHLGTYRHRVVVPARDIAAFRPYQNSRRELVAQEDVLPFRVTTIPASPLLGRWIKPLRRPLYIDRGMRVVRGWVLQQLLKIESAKTASEAAVLHVDSDTFFVRHMPPEAVVTGAGIRFFRASGTPSNPSHQTWVDASSRTLGLQPSKIEDAHYIENCVPWSRDVAREMVEHIQTTHGVPWYEVLVKERSFSEYYLYGHYVDRFRGRAGLHATDRPLCTSVWPQTGEETEAAVEAARQRMALATTFALAIQSTEAVSPNARGLIYQSTLESVQHR